METIQITINDIGKLRDFVNVAATRGAFRAEEFSEIGGVIDRANQFLTAYEEVSKNQASESADESEENNGDEDATA